MQAEHPSPIEEQLEIVNSYKAITERIDLKQKINDNLEEQVYALIAAYSGPRPQHGLEREGLYNLKDSVSNKIGNYPLVVPAE